MLALNGRRCGQSVLRYNYGVRQGSLLRSPYLFNIYSDDVASLNDSYKRPFRPMYADAIFSDRIGRRSSLCERELKFLRRDAL